MARAVVWPVAHNQSFNPEDPSPSRAAKDNWCRADGTPDHWAVLVADMVEHKFWWVDSKDTDSGSTFNGAARGAARLASM